MKNIIKRNSYTIFLGCTVIILSFLFSFSLNDQSLEKYQSVMIEDGDTLWDIATQFDVNHLSKAEFVAWVEERNGVKAEILQPGDTIKIPIKKEEMLVTSK